jgi:lipopolysaccharide O-acetyltransferase
MVSGERNCSEGGSRPAAFRLLGAAVWRPQIAHGTGVAPARPPPHQGGENLGTGRDLWLEAVALHFGRSYQPRIVIGDNVWMSDAVHIAANTLIEIGSDVLIGSKVLITDHQHGNYRNDPSDPSIPPAQRALTGLKTSIGDKVWLGDGVVVMPGVTIGEGSIIGANSVVTRDIGAFTIAAGAPARPLKEYDPERRTWRTVAPVRVAQQ